MCMPHPYLHRQGTHRAEGQAQRWTHTQHCHLPTQCPSHHPRSPRAPPPASERKPDSFYPLLLWLRSGFSRKATVTAPCPAGDSHTQHRTRELRLWAWSSTRVKDFSHRHSQVAILLEVLGDGGEVSCVHPPVGVEVIQARGVRPPPSEEGYTARGAHCLLLGSRSRGQHHHSIMCLPSPG